MVAVRENIADAFNTVVGNKVISEVVSTKVLVHFHAFVYGIQHFICFLELVV